MWRSIPTSKFQLNRGVRQGDALSATLFNLALQCALGTVANNGTIGCKSTHICAYADDIVIIAKNLQVLKETFEDLNENAKSMGLEINCEKTKYMIISKEA